MSNVNNWSERHNERLHRIQELVNEIVESHKEMQLLLSEAIVKCQIDRGIKDIEHFLSADEQ